MGLRGLYSPEGDASLWRAGPPRVHRGGGLSRACKEGVAWLRMGRPRPEGHGENEPWNRCNYRNPEGTFYVVICIPTIVSTGWDTAWQETAQAE